MIEYHFMAILVVFCLLMVTAAGCISLQQQQWQYIDEDQQVASLFVFGDSLFDPGNNNYINTTTGYQAKFEPYGISYFTPPSGRFSNGRLISDFIAEYARLPLISAYFEFERMNNKFVYGANFASGGAGALVETHAGYVIDLKTQLQRFRDLQKHFRKSLGDVKTKQLLSDAVYLFSCGANDYLSPFGYNDTTFMYTPHQYVHMVIGNLTRVFKGIYKKGGRKIGILNMAPLGCLPIFRAASPRNTCNKELDTISSLHNRLLYKKLEKLKKKLQGFKYSIFDFSTAFNNMIKNPTKYGMKVVDRACCGSGRLRGTYSCGGKRGIKEFELCDNINDYLFFDSVHPTEVASRQYADMFWDGDSNITTPYNLKTLFQAN